MLWHQFHTSMYFPQASPDSPPLLTGQDQLPRLVSEQTPTNNTNRGMFTLTEMRMFMHRSLSCEPTDKQKQVLSNQNHSHISMLPSPCDNFVTRSGQYTCIYVAIYVPDRQHLASFPGFPYCKRQKAGREAWKGSLGMRLDNTCFLLFCCVSIDLLLYLIISHCR